MKKRFAVAAVLLSVALMAGCASVSKVPYPPQLELQPDKALVYVYRPSNFKDSAVVLKAIFNEKEEAARIYNGGYTPYQIAPGHTVFTLKKSIFPYNTYGKVTFNPQAGRSYYIRVGTTSITQLAVKPYLVDEAKAKGEIQACSWFKP